MKRRLSALVAGLVLSLFTLTTLAAAAAGDLAKGRGTTFSERFSFSANGTGAGDRANGNMSHTFTSQDPNVTVTGNVTCIRIIGRSATVGGVITGFKPAGAAFTFGNPQGFVIFATDNAKPSGGLDGYFLNFQSVPPPTCPAPFVFSGSVLTGDIEIIPGTP